MRTKQAEQIALIAEQEKSGEKEEATGQGNRKPFSTHEKRLPGLYLRLY